MMRRSIFRAVFLIGLALNAAGAIPPDVVFPKEGEPVVGRVRGIETLFLVVQTTDAPEPARVALTDIERVEFGEARLAEAFLDRAMAAPLEDLEKFWEQRRPLLEVPGSTGGVIGLRLARRQIEQGTLTGAAAAQELADVIAQKDWNPETRQEAGALRAAALLALGRTLEAGVALDRVKATPLGEPLRSQVALWEGDLELQRGNRRAAVQLYLRPYVFGGADAMVRLGLEKARTAALELPDAKAQVAQIDHELNAFRAAAQEEK